VGHQNQTYRQEIAGGYIWAPKRNADAGPQSLLRVDARGFSGRRGIFVRGHKDYCDRCRKVLLLGMSKTAGVRYLPPDLQYTEESGGQGLCPPRAFRGTPYDERPPRVR
jgi:hypothetical protein